MNVFYDVGIDNENPDYLFFSTEDFGTSNKKFDAKKEVVKILFTGENKRPENYSCNYAISFDHNFNSWHYRLPLYVVDMWCIPNASGLKQYPFGYIMDFKSHGRSEPKSQFCGFVHRNQNNPIRNVFFHALGSYKQVTSAGPLFNNTGTLVDGIGGKIDFFKTCKFALCFENSSNPGYVTEKILHAFYAGAIPIYWGSPTIGMDFNEDAFINVGKFENVNLAIDKVREIDDNDILYRQMLSQPKVKYNIPNECMNLMNFLYWFDSIVTNRRFMRSY